MNKMARLLFLQDLQYEFLGPMYVSSFVQRHGHECSMAIGRTLDDFREKIRFFKPDMIGFSVMTGSHLWALKMAREIKKEFGLPNIFGGAHPTFFPGFLEEEGVDMIVRGEGEFAVLEVLDALEKRIGVDHIENLGYKRGDEVQLNPLRKLPDDLDEYPFPDRQLYDELDGKLDRSVRNVLTSRGCPFHCSFCFEDSMREMYQGKGKYIRIREVDKIIEECILLKGATDVKTIYFADDLFGMHRKWLYDFLEVYREKVNIPFVCLVRADIVSFERDYAFNLAKAGCRSVFFGIESGNEDLRNKVLKKKLSDKQIYLAAQYLHEAGIRFRTYNIMGLPGETLEDAFKTVQINIAIRTDYPWCSIFSPIPGVALTDQAIREGYLPADFNPSKINQSFFLDNQLNIHHKKDIINLQKFFQTAVKFPKVFPIIKLLIKLPPNPLFIAWFGVMYFLMYIRSEQKRFFDTLKFALRNWRYVLAKQ